MSELNSVLIKENEFLKNKNIELYKKCKNLQRSKLRIKKKYNNILDINNDLNEKLINTKEIVEEDAWENIE